MTWAALWRRVVHLVRAWRTARRGESVAWCDDCDALLLGAAPVCDECAKARHARDHATFIGHERAARRSCDVLAAQEQAKMALLQGITSAPHLAHSYAQHAQHNPYGAQRHPLGGLGHAPGGLLGGLFS